ncbi:MAG: hypothetical protein LR011_04670, partial [Verrucomicrobia bacterium]|nr:hypothetical protein [Verrucomicrobiota bacterium]
GSNRGDGNADSVPDSQQAHVTSFPALSGHWWTVVSDADLAFKNVQPAGFRELASPPAEFAFPVGFVTLTLSNLVPGGTTTLTHILHQSPVLTTVFAFGPMPGQPQPHWHKLESESTGNEIRVSFTDGGVGDQDASQNGSITTTYGFAFPKPTIPDLTLRTDNIEWVNHIQLTQNGSDWMLTTNRVPSVTTVLQWPIQSGNWFLQTTDSLSTRSTWQNIVREPTALDGWNVITNRSASPQRFFRLRQF